MRLSDTIGEAFSAGLVLRTPGIVPYESIVDFMLIDLPEGGLAFVIATGAKAGRIRRMLPAESYFDGNSSGLSAAWLVHNWERWFGPEFGPDDVQVIRRYPAPESMSFL